MESYSKRNNVLQHRAQVAFRRIMDDATTEVGLNRVDWLIQQGGDGELAILPPGTSERVAAARLDALLDELRRSTGRGGRSRPFADAGERARTAVRKAIKRAITEIGESEPALGEMLDRTVVTGTTCVYTPDPARPVNWTF